jgi:arabinofuranan 3-O-arabinosyltransferase
MPPLDLLRDAAWLGRDRVMRWGAAFAVLALVLIAIHVVRHTTAGVTDATGEQLASDFINYWSGALLAERGQAATAYDFGAYHAFQQSLVGPASDIKAYSYPPIAMLLCWPLAGLAFIPALAVWTIGGGALCWWSLSRLLDWRLAALATVGAPATFLNVLTGQNGYFTAALLGTGLTVLDRRPVLAGVLFGLLAYKPHLGVLLPVALLAGRYWRAACAAAATVAVLVAASLALLGVDAWRGFAAQTALQRLVLEFGAAGWHRMPTVFVALRTLGAGSAVAYGGQIASAALAMAAVAIVWRGRCALGLKAAILVVGTFLATPYAQDYDMVVLLFAAAWLLGEARDAGFLPWERIALAGLLILPLVTMTAGKLTGIQFAPVALWALLALLLRRVAVSGVPGGIAAAGRASFTEPGISCPLR